MKENSKNLIVSTALRLFAEEGYANTTIKKIAETAQVAQGLTYNYFKSKEELLLAIFQQGFEQVALSMQAYQGANSPLEAIKKHLDATVELVKQNQAFWKLLHSIRLQNPQFLANSPEILLMQEKITKTLSINFQQLGIEDSPLEARLFFALIDGIVIHYVLNPENYPLDELKNLIMQKYENLPLVR
jgi:AcrR family transcriptional regulator